MSGTDDGARLQLRSAAWRRSLQRRLKAWFRKHARDLPWRHSLEPYPVWVSEIMLQQTQVVTVTAYFERFMKRFPTIASLAEANEEDVLMMWEGLGYYRRARQLYQAAQVIIERHHGRFPRNIDVVRSLPGIGRYTAGAILSIALNQRHPILEANSMRVLSRLAAYRGDSSRSLGQQYLWNLADELLPTRDVGTFNQALMELGSQICTPRHPRCHRCPVRPLCATFKQGLQQAIPRPTKKPNYEDICEAAVIIQRRGRILLRRCRDGERWAGMWDYPRIAVRSRNKAAVRRELEEYIASTTGLKVHIESPWRTIKHGVTRFRITLVCYHVDRVSGRTANDGETLRWVRPVQLDQYPLSVTGRKISCMLTSQ